MSSIVPEWILQLDTALLADENMSRYTESRLIVETIRRLVVTPTFNVEQQLIFLRSFAREANRQSRTSAYGLERAVIQLEKKIRAL